MTENILFELSASQTRDNNIDFEQAIVLAERLDFIDIKLLSKFNMNGREQPFQ